MESKGCLGVTFMMLIACVMAACTVGSVTTRRITPAAPAAPVAVTRPAIQDDPYAPAPCALADPKGMTGEERFRVPSGYVRKPAGERSFGEYLRKIPLRSEGTRVKYFDGTYKPNSDVYEAVLDIDVGTKDLQQCADAIMRLRAEYLWELKKHDEIHFNFANGFRADYTKWAEGYRISVQGNKAAWVKSAGPSREYQDFRQYLDVVFTYANTVSLAAETMRVSTRDMQIGDFFVDQGHAVLIVDMAEKEGEKVFMVAQSYMPAQDIHILRNPKNPAMSPWYSQDSGSTLRTPEWTFKDGDLHRFK